VTLDGSFHLQRDQAQNVVPDKMPICVVEALEVIDVAENQRKRLPALHGGRHEPVQRLVEMLAIS